MSNALRLLRAIHEKTGGRDRGVRDVTELETGLTAKAAREAWRELLDQGLIERFSQEYAARLSFKGIDLISSGGPVQEFRPVSSRPPTILIARGGDDPAAITIANFLGELDLEAVAIDGPGLMQKMGTHHSLSYAVVLLTAEDLGPTPSRHVMMDVGYLMGRFGAARIFAFAVEPGEDSVMEFAGLDVHPIDASGAWKEVLSEELRQAGFELSPVRV